jgi:cellulose synthase/poly-beta-1,6-N-acetylglucosamine synthase-like glycosyltransferase
MSHKQLVTIIIPVYNGSNYLSEAIKSAIAQSYEKDEIIVINHGLNDNGKTRDVTLSFGNAIKYLEKSKLRLISFHLTQRYEIQFSTLTLK